MQISLIEFSVKNYKSINNKITFSLLGRDNKKHTFKSNEEKLLKSSFIYGPNASGKSSILKALINFRQAVLTSANISEDLNEKEAVSLPHEPFLANKESSEKPSFFELVFSLEDGKFKGVYKYNFSFLASCIVEEELNSISEYGAEKKIFSRKHQTIEIGKTDLFKNYSSEVKNKTRKEALFLSIVAQFNNEFAQEILGAVRNINIISADNAGAYQEFTIKQFSENSDYKTRILEYLQKADFCIDDGYTEKKDSQVINFSAKLGNFSAHHTTEKRDILFFKHPVFDEKGKKVDEFTLNLGQESAGTQNFTALLGPVIDTLKEGKALFVDEFDSSLHPLLTKFVIDLFESSRTNPNNAQLVAVAHDVNLLSYRDRFIRDQFWFTEKNKNGETSLFSLAEFSKLRNDTEYAKKYLEGRFGALPAVENLN